jgi:hypothetical protein
MIDDVSNGFTKAKRSSSTFRDVQRSSTEPVMCFDDEFAAGGIHQNPEGECRPESDLRRWHVDVRILLRAVLAAARWLGHTEVADFDQRHFRTVRRQSRHRAETGPQNTLIVSASAYLQPTPGSIRL